MENLHCVHKLKILYLLSKPHAAASTVSVSTIVTENYSFRVDEIIIPSESICDDNGTIFEDYHSFNQMIPMMKIIIL